MWDRERSYPFGSPSVPIKARFYCLLLCRYRLTPNRKAGGSGVSPLGAVRLSNVLKTLWKPWQRGVPSSLLKRHSNRGSALTHEDGRHSDLNHKAIRWTPLIRNSNRLVHHLTESLLQSPYSISLIIRQCVYEFAEKVERFTKALRSATKRT